MISPGKSDILRYYGGADRRRQPSPTSSSRGPPACATPSSAPLPLIDPAESVLIGLPDTIWFPRTGSRPWPTTRSAFLLFPVERPELFDAVVTGRRRAGCERIWVKSRDAALALDLGCVADAGRASCTSCTGCGAARDRQRRVSGHAGQRLARPAAARPAGVRAGAAYVDVGTLHGYRAALELLQARRERPAGLRRGQLLRRTDGACRGSRA